MSHEDEEPGRQRRRLDEEDLPADDVRIARLVHALVAEQIAPHVQAMKDAVSGAALSEDERRWVRLAIEREGRREQLHRAVMEHTLRGLVWVILAGLAAMLWEGLKGTLGVKS